MVTRKQESNPLREKEIIEFVSFGSFIGLV